MYGPEYRAPAWCFNAHLQTVLGYGRMATIFLKYDRQLVECADGGQVGLDWLRRARFTRPAPVPPPRNSPEPAPAPAHAAAAAVAAEGRNIRAGLRNMGAGFPFPAGLG